MKFKGYDKDFDLKNPKAKFGFDTFIKSPKQSLLIGALACVGIFGLSNTYYEGNTVEEKTIDNTGMEEEVQEITGDSKEEFGSLEYYINGDIDYTEKPDEIVYSLIEDENYPKLILTIEDEDIDYIDKKIDEKWIEEKIETDVSNKDIKKLKSIRVRRDGVACYKVSYSNGDDEDIVLNQVYYIPTHKGLYSVGLITYKDDEDDYGFSDFIYDLELKNLVENTLKQKEEDAKKAEEERLNTYKNTINTIVIIAGANDQEKEIFETRKNEALSLVDNKKTNEEIDASIAQLKQTNADIQARLDQEKAALEAEKKAQEEAQRLQFEAEQQAEQEALTRQATISTYVLNGNTGKFHVPTCRDVSRMAEHNKVYKEATRDEIIAMGYSPCQHCWP